MASQSDGIKKLLNAEKQAADKVAEARKRKAKRLKEAKEQAQAEIDAYRKERERAYQEHEAKIMGSRGDTEQQVDEVTKMKLLELGQNVKANKEKALKRLLEVVCDIQPELHRNYGNS